MSCRNPPSHVSLIGSFYATKMDVYDVNAHVFKYDTLQSYVARPFQQHWTTKDSTEPDERARRIFYAGLGNTLFGMHAYHHAGIALHRMFLIDKQSRIYCLDQTDIQLELHVHHQSADKLSPSSSSSLPSQQTTNPSPRRRLGQITATTTSRRNSNSSSSILKRNCILRPRDANTMRLIK
jgi:hypothetical protein